MSSNPPLASDDASFDPAAEEIVEAVHALRHLFRGYQDRALQDEVETLTHMEGRVINFFGRAPGATQSELIAHVARDKGQMARLVSGLRERGLIDARPDETDKRVQRLYLTKNGQRVRKTVERERLRIANLAVADLDQMERQQLFDLLRRVRHNLEGRG